MAKYDWKNLKDEFVRGNWLTIASFFHDKSIPNTSRNRINAKHWKEAKIAYQERIITQTQEKFVEDEVSVRLRQQRIAKALQAKGLEKLKHLEINDVEDARKLVVSGLQEERESMGMTKTPIHATQININSSNIKTNLDEWIEKASYIQLLEMIGELKRLKEERTKK